MHKKVPFWLQIVLILLIGVCTSAAIFMIAQDRKTERFTVSFTYSDGTVIEKKEVKSGNGVFPPLIETDDVFRGWNVAINAVTANIETHPMIYSIVEDNLFYFDSVYVKEGKKFSVDLMLSGNVNVSSGDLTMEYDSEVLKYNKIKDESICKVTEEKPGLLTISFSSDTVISMKTHLAELQFDTKRADAYSTEIRLKSTNVKIVTDGQEAPVDNATINNKIYFLQEVG